MKAIGIAINLLKQVMYDKLKISKHTIISNTQYEKLLNNDEEYILTDCLPRLTYHTDHGAVLDYAVLGVSRGTLICGGIFDTEVIDYFEAYELSTEELIRVYEYVMDTTTIP